MSNNIVIVGNIGKDPEKRTTQGGTNIASFSIASKTGKDETTWFNCSAFGKTADLVMEYVKKGSLISVVGVVKITKKDDKYYTNVNVDKVHLLGGKKEEAAKDVNDDADSETIPF